MLTMRVVLVRERMSKVESSIDSLLDAALLVDWDMTGTQVTVHLFARCPPSLLIDRSIDREEGRRTFVVQSEDLERNARQSLKQIGISPG